MWNINVMMVKVNKEKRKGESPGVKKTVKNGISKKKGGKLRGFRREKWERPKQDRGVVYLRHIPHGFYEDQILQYFRQFGKVTGHNLPRAKTGRSKGYAFVEFEHPEVAKIAAEAMNDYLMFDRLLKAEYIPPEYQKPKKFFLARKNKEMKRTLEDVAVKARETDRDKKNRALSQKEETNFVRKQKNKISILQKKLSKWGLNYDIQVANEPVVLTKASALSEDEEMLIVDVDESDDEISFKTPPNAVKKTIKKENSENLLLDNKENEKKEKRKRKRKAKKNKLSENGINGSMKSRPVMKKSFLPSAVGMTTVEEISVKTPKKTKSKFTDMKNNTEMEYSLKSAKIGGILKKFKKSETTENNKTNSKLLGVVKRKGKPTNTESEKLKKKMKGFNLVGVKQMMNTFV